MRSFLASYLILIASMVSAAPIAVKTPERPTPVSYAKEVSDILDAKCVGCHGEFLSENKLNLESVPRMLKGGKRGPSIVPGKANQSLLFTMAAHRVDPVMPPKDKKDAKPLTPEELGLIKLWIDAGAKDDSDTAEAPAPVQLGALPPGVHPINAVDITADGTRVACGRANVVQVYDVDSGLEVISLGGHKDLIQSIRYSPDGRRLAAGSYQIVTLWNVPKGGLKATFSGHADQVKAVAFEARTQAVISGGLDRTIRFWDAEGKPLRQFPSPAPVLALAVAADGSRLVTGGADGVVRFYDLTNGSTLKELFTFEGHTGPVNDVSIIGAEKVVSASTDGTARVWAVPVKPGEKPAPPMILGGSSAPLRAVAVKGGTIITAGDFGKIQLWTLDGGKPLRTLDIPGGLVLSIAVSSVIDRLLVGSADKIARLIDLNTGEIMATFGGHLNAVNSVAFSADGSQIATAGAEGGVKIWDAATGQGVIAFGHTAPNNQPIQPIQKVIFSGGGSLITASADKTLKSWTYEGHWSEMKPLGPHAFRVLALDFNPDGTLLASGGGEPSRSGEIKLWEVGKGLLVRTLDGLHSDTVFGVRFSPDGSRLASAGADKFMKVTRVSDGKEIRSFEGHTHHVLAVDWKSDGKQIVTGGGDNVIKLWDVETGEQVRTFAPASKQVTAVRWLSGKTDVAGASGDKFVRLWNADNGGVRLTFSGPGDYVFGVAASADGLRIAAGGADGVLFVWNGQNTGVIRKIEPAAAAKESLK